MGMWTLFLAFSNVQAIRAEFAKLWMHALGRLSAPEMTFVPWSERFVVYRQARIFLSIYALIVLLSCYCRSPLPVMYVLLPYSVGAWHFILLGIIQHASLQQDVLDHRL